MGTGGISAAYVDAVSALPGAEIAGVVSRGRKIPPALSEAGKSVPVAPELPGIDVPYDAVIIATPNGLHHQGTLAAAGLGKHVLTEKVLDASLQACDQMIEACRTAGTTLAVCYQRRTSPTNRRVKKLIEAGAFGRIFAVEIEAKFYRTDSYYQSAGYRGGKEIDGGGPFIQQASHDLDLLTWFFGRPVSVASAYGTFLHQIEGEDHGVAVLKFADGMVGSVIASTCCPPGSLAKMTIHSDRGHLVLQGDEILVCEMTGLSLDEIAAVPLEPISSGHAGIVADFVAAVQTGRPPLVSGAEARASVELIHRIYDSAI